MSLLDIADRLNKRHEQEIKAAEEVVRQAEIKSRRLSYYQEHGRKWFLEIAAAIDELITRFNAVTGDHSKLERVNSEEFSDDLIRVIFLRLNQTNDIPVCILRRDFQELMVALEIDCVKAPSKDEYEVLVKKFAELRVHVKMVTRTQSLGEGVEWKNRETGNMEYEPTFVTKTIRNTHELTAYEFADFALTKFVEKML